LDDPIIWGRGVGKCVVIRYDMWNIKAVARDLGQDVGQFELKYFHPVISARSIAHIIVRE